MKSCINYIITRVKPLFYHKPFLSKRPGAARAVRVFSSAHTPAECGRGPAALCRQLRLHSTRHPQLTQLTQLCTHSGLKLRHKGRSEPERVHLSQVCCHPRVFQLPAKLSETENSSFPSLLPSSHFSFFLSFSSLSLKGTTNCVQIFTHSNLVFWAIWN